MRRILGPILLGCAAAGLPVLRPPLPRPHLIVVLTVDQMRADYLSRWPGQWSGGLSRIYTEGAYFPNGLQDHALTETAPGTSTILSGRDPAHTGIVSNTLGVPDSTESLIGVKGSGASPRRFRGTTLVDWMRSADSGLRVLSVGRKDRAAILTIGRSKSPVYWYAKGQFTTSTWYADSLPQWVRDWNARGGISRLAGATWKPLLADSAYPEPGDSGFSYSLPTDSAAVGEALAQSPWMDSLALDLGLDGARALGLGARGRTDLLSVALSATDGIGHRFGPDSREIHDQLLRLDRWLGWFLDSLAATVPKDRIVVVLTADHGVTPLARTLQAQGKPAGHVSLTPMVQELNRMLGMALVKEGSGLIYADTSQLRQLKVNPESLATALTARVQRLPNVVDAWSPATLGFPPRSNIPAARWRRLLPPDFAFLVCAVLPPGYVWSDGDGGATHGSTNQDDVGVPIAFLGAGITPGIFPDTVRTVDIAPTLARLLDLKPPKRLDGRAIRRVAH